VCVSEWESGRVGVCMCVCGGEWECVCEYMFEGIFIPHTPHTYIHTHHIYISIYLYIYIFTPSYCILNTFSVGVRVVSFSSLRLNSANTVFSIKTLKDSIMLEKRY
jgi:hypothetical protein